MAENAYVVAQSPSHVDYIHVTWPVQGTTQPAQAPTLRWEKG